MMSEDLSITELAQQTGEPEERLRAWQSLGLIGRGDTPEFAPVDVERARLVQLFLRRGISLERIAEVDRAERFIDHYVDTIFPRGVSRAYSLAEAADRVGLPLAEVRRFWEASLPGEQAQTATEDDVWMLRSLKLALDAGFPEEALMQMMRVYSDALERVAEAEARLFHFYVHERLRAAGHSGTDLVDKTNAAQDLLTPLVEPAILFFHRRGLARAAREDAVLHLAEETGLLTTAEIPGQLVAATVFVDLSSFTPLADTMGDLAATRVLERFSTLVREEVRHWEGRVVKQVGDAFMLVFSKARSAVACALTIEQRVAAEPQFPAVRSGVHWGSVLYREGDYVGSNVNIAARLVGEALRHQVVVTAAVRTEIAQLPGVDFLPLGKRRLKGVAELLELFEARSSGVERQERLVDPVCGMELGPAEVAARLTLAGKEVAFCSEGCLRRFVAESERSAG